MSTYMVDDVCINKIITGLYLYDMYVPLKVVRTGKESNLRKKMMKMNVKAVKYRYGEKNKIPSDYEFKFVAVSFNGFIDALGELLYQCAEGKVSDKKLYKKLAGIYNHCSDTQYVGIG